MGDKNDNQAANSAKQLFGGLVLEDDANYPFYQTFYTQAEDIGEAIFEIRRAAQIIGLKQPWVVECDPWEDAEFEDPEIEIEKTPRSNVHYVTGRAFFKEFDNFKLPIGVVGCEGDDDTGDDICDLCEGFSVETDDDGLNVLEVNVDAQNLMDLYTKILNLHENYRVFWYKLHDHWGDTGEDKYLINMGLDSSAKILAHLNYKDNFCNSVENGFVSLTAYLTEGETNITISDHKRIIVSSFSDDKVGQVERLLQFNGFSRFPNLLNIDSKMYHWHFKPPGSLGNNELVRHLKANGFQDWKRQEN